MADRTGIAWTDATWNPIRGCSRVSEGCRHCYAETVAHRFSGPGQPYEGLTTKGKWNGTIRVVEEHLLDPLRWKRPRRVFVNSMSDLFHEAVSDETIDRIFAVMALSPQHTFQVLTKRPERMRAYCRTLGRHHEDDRVSLAAKALRPDGPGFMWTLRGGAFLDNVWLGVSVEDQATADARIPLLLQTPAAVRLISAEPLLGPIDLTSIAWPDGAWNHRVDVLRRGYWNAEGWRGLGPAAPLGEARGGFTNHSDMAGLDWVIVGGESGPGARPCQTQWITDIVRQCRSAGVPVFVKQLGSVSVVPAHRQAHFDYRFVKRPEDQRFEEYDTRTWRVRTVDRKGSDPDEWPDWLRVQEFPQAVPA